MADKETQKRWQQEKQQKEEARRVAEAKKPEVYREHYHDGWVNREKMKVSSDGERYYNPDDGEWHRIE